MEKNIGCQILALNQVNTKLSSPNFGGLWFWLAMVLAWQKLESNLSDFNYILRNFGSKTVGNSTCTVHLRSSHFGRRVKKHKVRDISGTKNKLEVKQVKNADLYWGYIKSFTRTQNIHDDIYKFFNFLCRMVMILKSLIKQPFIYAISLFHEAETCSCHLLYGRSS